LVALGGAAPGPSFSLHIELARLQAIFFTSVSTHWVGAVLMKVGPWTFSPPLAARRKSKGRGSELYLTGHSHDFIDIPLSKVLERSAHGGFPNPCSMVYV
jgi:hypothetical protein